jgi:hypothetical protein
LKLYGTFSNGKCEATEIVLLGKPKGNRPCYKIGQRCEENIKMDLTETEQVGVG